VADTVAAQRSDAEVALCSFRIEIKDALVASA
jgi:hypothetical protein